MSRSAEHDAGLDSATPSACPIPRQPTSGISAPAPVTTQVYKPPSPYNMLPSCMKLA